MSHMRITADLEAGTRVCQDLQSGGKSPRSYSYTVYYRLAKVHITPSLTQLLKVEIHPHLKPFHHHTDTSASFPPKLPSWPADRNCFTDRMQVNPFDYNSKRGGEKMKQNRLAISGTNAITKQTNIQTKANSKDFAKAIFWNGPRVWNAVRTPNIISSSVFIESCMWLVHTCWTVLTSGNHRNSPDRLLEGQKQQQDSVLTTSGNNARSNVSTGWLIWWFSDIWAFLWMIEFGVVEPQFSSPPPQKKSMELKCRG